MRLPLEGLLVVSVEQAVAAPQCTCRLADAGARVIKIERPDVGDLCRQLYISNLQLDGDFIKLHLQVGEADVGKVIGRGGRIAKAIRALLKVMATRDGTKVNLEID